jgi:hypothetical protein
VETAKTKNIRAIIRLLKSKGYKLFERPYELNIVGIRKDNNIPNKFDDTLYAFWKTDSGSWEGKYYTITTDPGTYWLKNPMSGMGAAILKEGQYVDAYKYGIECNNDKVKSDLYPLKLIFLFFSGLRLGFANK